MLIIFVVATSSMLVLTLEFKYLIF